MGGGPNRFALVVGVVWIALIGTASPPACAGPPPQDEAAFTDYVAQAFAHTAPSTHVTVVSPLTLSVDTAGGGQSMLYLNSLYSECRRDPDRCDGLVATWIDQMGAATSDKAAPLDRTMLRAVLRPEALVDEIRRAHHDEPVAAPFLAGLWTICVVDRPETIEYPTWTELAALHLSREKLLALCKANTLAHLRPIAALAHGLPPRAISLMTGNAYESSRLLAPESFAPLAGKAGRLLVSAPGTDLLLYARASDAKALDALATLTRELAAKAPKALSQAIFRWTPKGWVVVAPAH